MACPYSIISLDVDGELVMVVLVACWLGWWRCCVEEEEEEKGG